ncbi:MAG: hypothetical protein ACK58X_20865 [Planctomycetota bacterium]
MAKKSSAFPVGLYGALLVALCALTLPGAFQPVERALLGAVARISRAAAALAGEPVGATAAATAVDDQRSARSADVVHRVASHHVAGAPAELAARHGPVHCRVLAVGGRGGGGGAPCELRLDRTYADLADGLPFVTQGECFVGYLAQPGGAGAPDDVVSDLARVLLPNHPLALPLHAEVELAATSRLRVVVRPAAAADPAPVRVDLWDDPYAAARMDRALLPVRTRAVAGSASPVPGGLRLGTTRIWGYARTGDDEALTLGVFVAPEPRASALSHVVAWRRDAAGAGAEPALAAEVAPGVVRQLPGRAGGRFLLVADGEVPDGAAVVCAGALLGVAKPLAFGSGLVTAFAVSRQPWTFLLAPDGGDAPPIELRGAVVRAAGGQAWVRVLGDHLAASPLPATGELFTGSNGMHCPAGLSIGRCQADPQDLNQLVITLPALHGLAAARWCAKGRRS